MKAPSSNDELKSCKIMLKAPSSDLIIVQGWCSLLILSYLSWMKAPTSDEELKTCKIMLKVPTSTNKNRKMHKLLGALTYPDLMQEYQ